MKQPFVIGFLFCLGGHFGGGIVPKNRNNDIPFGINTCAGAERYYSVIGGNYGIGIHHLGVTFGVKAG